MSQFLPVPDPRGSLGPPRRDPPTAVALSTPEPEGRPLASGSGATGAWRRVALRFLDLADQLGGAIRRAFRHG